MDYRALDLTQYANAEDDIRAPHVVVWRGPSLLRGLPFSFPERRGSPWLLRVEPGSSLTVPVDAVNPIRTVTFAHRARGDDGPGLAPVGREDAVYTFTYADGEVLPMSIREGFEVGVPWLGPPEDWGVLPSLVVPDQGDSLPEREVGLFQEATRRMTEVVPMGKWSNTPGGPSVQVEFGLRGGWRYYLWSWVNPRPEQNVVQIGLEGRQAVVEVGGVCLGFVDEHPLRPEPACVVVADVPPNRIGDAAKLALTVDRGTVGFTTALLREPDAGDPFSAWGGTPGSDVVQVYARVSSIGSGTVRLMAGDESLLEQRWADLRRREAAVTTGLRVTELGRNWVRTRIVDEATDEPMPCRVNFSSPDGVPYQPYGHPHHVNSDLPSYHLTYGADVRLGRTTYAYVRGACEGWLPRGQVRVRAAHGFHYEALDEMVTIDDDTRELTLRLKRQFDPAKDGWYSGDTHVHFVSSFGGLNEAAAEGVSVVHLLASGWGSMFTNIEDLLGRPVVSDDGKTVLFTGQENRQHRLGHMNLLGLREPVMPWCTDGPEESPTGSGLEVSMSDWADRCRAQGGMVVIPHLPLPIGEQGVLIATGRVDAVESTATTHELSLLHYYRYLSAGYRLPIAGGTDKLSNDIPIGLVRTFVRLRAHDDFGFDAWCEGLKAGRSYMSSGPILELFVDGADIGDTVSLPENGGTVAVRARSRSIFPMFRLELVHSGRVVASAESESGAYELSLDENVRIDGPGWICARVGGGGPENLTQHRDPGRRAILAHTSPVYVACGERQHAVDPGALELIVADIERIRAYVEHRVATTTGTHVLHHHGGDHRAFFMGPFDQAIRAIEDRRRLAEMSE